jgi:mediator of RNA polymerase II transcription subunit 4
MLNDREMFEMLLLPKPQRQGAAWEHSHAQIAELLVAKDKELKHYLKQAADQEEIQKKSDAIRDEIRKLDNEIGQLQRNLQVAEQALAKAIYEAKQKLAQIHKANGKPLSSEELIKYAHRISASHAVAAPYNWEQGDPRRPYPTDIEMRSGWLGQGFSDAMLHPPHAPGPVIHPQQSMQLPHQQPQASGSGMDMNRPNGAGPSSQFQWSADGKSNMAAMPAVLTAEQKAKEQSLEEVEVMSTDSSSSSSSDSQ